MAFLGLIYILAAGLWAFALPAWLVSRLIVPSAIGIERLGLVSICGFSLYPLTVFLLTVLLGIPMDAGWILVCATAVNLALGWREYGQGTLSSDIGRYELFALAIGVLGITLLLLFGVRSLDAGDVFSTVHHCLYVIAMYAIGNDPATSIPLYDAVSGDVMHYVLQHPTTEFNGLAPLFYEQRIGNAPIVAPPIALFGTVGWLISPITSLTTLGICSHLAARVCGASGRASAISAVVMVYGMAMFTGYHINENTFAVAIAAFLLWACLRGQFTLGWTLIIGAAFGHLVGVRYTSSLFLPGVLAGMWLATSAGRERMRLFMGFALGSLATVSPWLYINWIMLGNPVGHPKVHSGFAARVVDNTLFGLKFKFRALNYPFTSEVVRTAWNPFPTFLWLPLQVGRCFGQLFVASAWVGLWRTRGRSSRLFLVILAFMLPHNMAMMWLESLDWEQLTYAAPGLVPLGPMIALGLEPLCSSSQSWRRRVRDVLPVLAVCIALVVVGLLIRDYRAPIDLRRLSQVGCAAPQKTDPGVEAMATVLTTPSPLPALPKFRTQLAADTWDGLGAAGPLAPAVTQENSVPVYPSGQAAILVAYSTKKPAIYELMLEGRAARTAANPIRSSLGLHMIALRLPAERVRFIVSRRGGESDGGTVGELYEIQAIIDTPSVTEKDFTLWIHPWNPPIDDMSIQVISGEGTRDDSPDRSTGVVDVHLLSYGTQEPGEQRLILTNYEPSIIDIVDVPLEVDSLSEPSHWGLALFLRRTDPSLVETLVLSGGHDMSWTGEGVRKAAAIKVPKPLYADQFVLYSEPYCSDHVPQYGDRYGVVNGPFNGQPIRVKLDKIWLPWSVMDE